MDYEKLEAKAELFLTIPKVRFQGAGLTGLSALYKQAVIGTCVVPAPGWSLLDWGRAHDEWEAWRGLGEMPAYEAARRYMQAIDEAANADAANGGARLIGHLYCRYFADLFGGQALAGPYRWALDLGGDSPRHYDFGEFGARRRESIEAIYAAINEAGELLDDSQLEAVVEEARVAFGHNVSVYSEEGRLYSDGAIGLAKMAVGFGRSRMGTAST